MLLKTTSLGIKKLSVIKYNTDILVELEVEDELDKCISLEKPSGNFSVTIKKI